MNYQVIVKNNAATKQPIIKREYERRITYKESSVTIEDVIVTKIEKPKPTFTLNCETVNANEYFHHLVRFINRYQAYKSCISECHNA